MIENRGVKAIVLSDNVINKMLILREGVWSEARQVDKEKYIEQRNQKFLVKHDTINNFIGFMSVFKNNEVTFKTKDISQKRNNKGALCANAAKNDIIKRLNFILEENIYFIQKVDGILKIGLCVIMEFILRYFTETNFKGRGKIYFMDNERALLNSISDI